MYCQVQKKHSLKRVSFWAPGAFTQVKQLILIRLATQQANNLVKSVPVFLCRQVSTFSILWPKKGIVRFVCETVRALYTNNKLHEIFEVYDLKWLQNSSNQHDEQGECASKWSEVKRWFDALERSEKRMNEMWTNEPSPVNQPSNQTTEHKEKNQYQRPKNSKASPKMVYYDMHSKWTTYSIRCDARIQ